MYSGKLLVGFSIGNWSPNISARFKALSCCPGPGSEWLQWNSSFGAFPVLQSTLPCLFEVCLPLSSRDTCINTLSSHLFSVLLAIISSCRSSSSWTCFRPPVLLMKTVVCSSTWVACLYRMSYSLFHLNLSVLLLSDFQTSHLMWAAGGGGEVYSGVATSGTATQPLMLLPSAARCRCSVREPSVLASEMNGKPVGGARLRGLVVSPLLHAEAGICLWPGRLPALGEMGGGGGWIKGSYNLLAQDNIVYAFMWPGAYTCFRCE